MNNDEITRVVVLYYSNEKWIDRTSTAAGAGFVEDKKLYLRVAFKDIVENRFGRKYITVKKKPNCNINNINIMLG